MCIHKVIPKCQSTRFHTAKFLVMLIAIIIIILFIVVIIFWLWNVPPLAEVVENGTYSEVITVLALSGVRRILPWRT